MFIILHYTLGKKKILLQC